MSYKGKSETKAERLERHKRWQEAKRALRRNVRLRIKAGLYEDLREEPKKYWAEHDGFGV